MKKISFILNLILIVCLALPACTPTPTVSPSPTATPAPLPAATPTPGPTAVPSATPTAAPTEPLYLNLTWHQHQPLYYKNAEGVYTRPWVRAHATKDYWDMAATLAKYPAVHVTFNLTPVLLKQIDDYVSNQAKDLYWTLAEKPAAQLTQDDKRFLLTRFFDANWDHIIRVHPGYKKLLDLRGGTTEEAITQALTTFSEADYRDLQVWFNLAWMDPDLLAQEPLKSLVQKDHGFSEADKTPLFNEVRRVMADIVPLHKKLQDAGQIEVITTPYAHPILPLLYDTDQAKIGNPQAELPARFMYVNDAMRQLDRSVELYQKNFGKAPRGLWPAEGAVSKEIVPLVSNAGYRWMASGEQVLAQSLGIGAFTRSAKDTVQQADQLYRPYLVSGRADSPIQGGPVMMVFRDLLISDKLGFTYSGTPGEQAAADFMQRLEDIRTRLKEENAQGPHLVSIILDGENAWENYDNDGKEFLNALYRKLAESQTIKTLTPSEYLAQFPEQKKLDNLFPGAWFSANYDTWIGEPEETAAWNLLGQVRKDLAEYDIRKSKTAPSPEALQKAIDYMDLAEGSDWFWWYGADQDSGDDSYFDEGFRALLSKVYESLNLPVPAALRAPIIPRRVQTAQKALGGLFTPTIDGSTGSGEWDLAAEYPASGGAQARSEDVAARLSLGLDAKNLYLRLEGKNAWAALPRARVSFYVGSARLKSSLGTARPAAPGVTPAVLGFGAAVLAEIDLSQAKGQLYQAGAAGWEPAEVLSAVGVKDKVLEAAIPLSALGEQRTGDELKIVAVVSSAERDLQTLPGAGPAQLILPDLAPVAYFLEIADPEGDDHGGGSLTYPTDAVFTPSAFDLTSFQVGSDARDLIFRFTFKGKISNAWNGPNGFSVQTLDVYIDTDPGAGSGARLLLPGRNAALEKGNGWDIALWAESWTPQVVAPDAKTLEPKQVAGSSFKILVDPEKNAIILRAPKETFGSGDPSKWGYAAVVLGQEGYPAAGVWRVRDVNPQAEQWRFGGNTTSASNFPRIIDLAWPKDGQPVQEALLSAFKPSTQPAGELQAEDLPSLPLLLKK